MILIFGLCLGIFQKPTGGVQVLPPIVFAKEKKGKKDKSDLEESSTEKEKTVVGGPGRDFEGKGDSTEIRHSDTEVQEDALTNKKKRLAINS